MAWSVWDNHNNKVVIEKFLDVMVEGREVVWCNINCCPCGNCCENCCECVAAFALRPSTWRAREDYQASVQVAVQCRT